MKSEELLVCTQAKEKNNSARFAGLHLLLLACKPWMPWSKLACDMCLLAYLLSICLSAGQSVGTPIDSVHDDPKKRPTMKD